MGQCYCSGKCKDIVGYLEGGKFTPIEGMSDLLQTERAKNLWGADIEDCNEFSKKITKNAGPRDI